MHFVGSPVLQRLVKPFCIVELEILAETLEFGLISLADAREISSNEVFKLWVNIA